MAECALIVVDVQYDFMPDGALPVGGGYEVVPLINDLIAAFDTVVATQDWHPPDHCSFASNHAEAGPGEVVEVAGLDQILWPDHCVQDTRGAEFVDDLDTASFDAVFQKGTDRRYDSYSGFYDNGRQKATGLSGYLDDRGIDTVFIAGVATDYCVKYTVLDSCRDGFDTHLVVDDCRGVFDAAGDVERAVAEMVKAGGTVVSHSQVS